METSFDFSPSELEEDSEEEQEPQIMGWGYDVTPPTPYYEDE